MRAAGIGGRRKHLRNFALPLALAVILRSVGSIATPPELRLYSYKLVLDVSSTYFEQEAEKYRYFFSIGNLQFAEIRISKALISSLRPTAIPQHLPGLSDDGACYDFGYVSST